MINSQRKEQIACLFDSVAKLITGIQLMILLLKTKTFFFDPEMALMAPEGENQLLCSTLCSSFEQEF